jgi:hypothetical protein
MSPKVEEHEVFRCVDCMKCVLNVPRGSKRVFCRAGVFKDLPLAHPFIIVYRRCDFADIELDWSVDQSERRNP